MNTETDQRFLDAGVSVHLQPDSEHFRMWEMAGTAHGDQYLLDFLLPDFAKAGLPPAVDCGSNPPINAGPATYGTRAAMRSLDLWIRLGIAPPKAPRLSVAIPAPPAAVSINRDPATGLAVGGVRYPQIAVPIATETGDRPVAALAGFNPGCVLFGARSPWDGDKDPWDVPGLDPAPLPAPDLNVLYPTHHRYVREVKRAAFESVQSGFLLREDAREIIDQAKAAPVP